ncbi:MAG: hypothetical protein ACOH19_09995 [Rhodoglobus sp.]
MTATLDLRYEGKWWLLLPNSFPSGDDGNLNEWAARVALQYPAQELWNAAPLQTELASYLTEQFTAIDPERTAALWFCPSGLPADGYVQITLSDDTDMEDVTFEQIVSNLTAQLDFSTEKVSTHNLGEGVAFARVRAGQVVGDKALPGYGESTYLFHPPGHLLVVSARSADPSVVGLMSESLWDIVESITIND